MRIANIREKARRLRKIYGNNPYVIAKELGISFGYHGSFDEFCGKEVLWDELPKGICCTLNNCIQYISICPNLNEHERRMVFAHELAHALLHPHLDFYEMISNNLSRPTRHEIEANIFACEILLDDDIFDDCNCLDNEDTYITLASKFNVSLEFILYKSNNHNLSI